MTDFHLTPFFFFTKKKRKNFDVDFKRSPVFNLSSFFRHSFQDVENIFKRNHLNNDCYSLHFRFTFVVNGPSSWAFSSKCYETQNWCSKVKKYPSILRSGKFNKIACTDLQGKCFVSILYLRLPQQQLRIPCVLFTKESFLLFAAKPTNHILAIIRNVMPLLWNQDNQAEEAVFSPL